MEFNTQVCTTREQSQRLLDLGLKGETAECPWCYHRVTATWYVVAHNYDGIGGYIPAWSLHRLIALYSEGSFSASIDLVQLCFDIMIDAIESKISSGKFNKEYLEEPK